MNPRPPAPKAGALPGCATPRQRSLSTCCFTRFGDVTSSTGPAWLRLRPSRLVSLCPGRGREPTSEIHRTHGSRRSAADKLEFRLDDRMRRPGPSSAAARMCGIRTCRSGAVRRAARSSFGTHVLRRSAERVTAAIAQPKVRRVGGDGSPAQCGLSGGCSGCPAVICAHSPGVPGERLARSHSPRSSRRKRSVRSCPHGVQPIAREQPCRTSHRAGRGSARAAPRPAP